jgi:hypothetical protein
MKRACNKSFASYSFLHQTTKVDCYFSLITVLAFAIIDVLSVPGVPGAPGVVGVFSAFLNPLD